MASRDIRFLRKLPQQAALTGMRGRTAITESYGSRFGSPSQSPLAQMGVPTAPRRPQPPPRIPIPFNEQQGGGGPGVGPGEGDAGGFEGVPGGGTDTSGLSTMMGNSMATGMLGRGVKGVANLAARGAQFDAPVSTIAGFAPQALAMAALSPLSIASNVIGKGISGQTAFSAAEESPSLSADLADLTAQSAFVNSPQSIPGHLAAMIGIGDPASEAAAAAVAASEQGAQSMTGIAASHDDPVAASLMTTDPTNLSNVVASSLATEAGPGGTDGGGATPGGSMGPAGTPGAAGMDAGPDGGGGGGGGGTYLCSELYRQGLMSDEIYKADVAFGATLPDEIMKGYAVFAIPLARLMAKSRVVTAIAKPFVMKWALHISGERNWFGAIALKVGIPLCRLLNQMAKVDPRKGLSPNQKLRQPDPV